MLAQKSSVLLETGDETELMDQLKGTPAMGKVSQINGIVNRYTVEELRRVLREFHIEDEGSVVSLRLRLKHHMRSEVMNKMRGGHAVHRQYYDVICVIDFEATCEEESIQSQSRDAQEIIEFPAFLIDVKKRQIISTFHQHARPSKSPVISPFCTNLTGITQEMIDKAPAFTSVIDSFESWLYSQLQDHSFTSFALASDGSWDFAHFLPVTCHVNSIPFPAYAKRWINVRKVFSTHYHKAAYNLSSMLSHLGMVFEGRKHCGFDDCNNIARLLIRMLVDGAVPVINERISWHSAERSCWKGIQPGFLKIFSPKPSDGLHLSDSDDEVFRAAYPEEGAEPPADPLLHSKTTP